MSSSSSQKPEYTRHSLLQLDGDHPGIVIEVQGGIVQEVYCTDGRATAIVVDWDDDSEERWHIGERFVEPIDELYESETEQAILSAYKEGSLYGKLPEEDQAPSE